MHSGSAPSQDQHQKDLFNSFFSSESSTPSSEHDHQRSRQPPQDIFQGNLTNSTAPHPSLMVMQQQQQQSMGTSHVGMDVLESMIAMQERAVQASGGSQGIPTATPQMLLEQQVRLNQLQQLQQLQNQIFQQQIELLSGNASFSSIPPMMDRSRDLPQFGLPTPASSTELHAQPNTDFVSPMILQSGNSPMGNMAPTNQLPPNFIPQHMIPPTPHSAPANIAFASNQYPIPSPAELDYGEISPLTSPWLGAYTNNNNNNNQAGGDPAGGRGGQVNQNTSGKKRRTSSTSGDETSNTTTTSGRPQRKRQLSSARVGGGHAPPVTSHKKAGLRGTRSANSTPLFPPAANSRLSPRRNGPTIGDVPTDTPSPVELSMPPPAPPSQAVQFVHGNSGQGTQGGQVRGTLEHLTPVTPASIMNLGRLGTNSALVPSQATQSPNGGSAAQEKTTKNRVTTRSRASTVSIAAQPGSKTSSAMPLVSPSLKPIRPAGNAGANSASPSMPHQQQPVLQVRKTSHKAAEQKRRDSLKTSFDDLRMLLPPIPLPSDEGYPDEPVLPGAMPPRGPPKGNVDGPNRGVSKLQLLRCGNDYIRVLKGRVDRRDDEIEVLRKEIRRLRLIVSEGDREPPEGEEGIDLDKDLDACEFGIGNLLTSAAGSANGLDGEECDGESGE